MSIEGFPTSSQEQGEDSSVKAEALAKLISEKIANKELAGVLMQSIIDNFVDTHYSLSPQSELTVPYTPEGMAMLLEKEFKNDPFDGHELSKEELSVAIKEARSIYGELKMIELKDPSSLVPFSHRAKEGE